MVSGVKAQHPVHSFKDHETCLYGFINTLGDTVKRPQFSYVGSQFDSLQLIQQGNLVGLIDLRKGTLALPLRYQSVLRVHDTHHKPLKSWFLLAVDGKFGLYHLEKGWIHQAEFRPFTSNADLGGFIAMKQDSSVHYLDTNGFSHDFGKNLQLLTGGHKNFVLIIENGKVGLLSKNGERVLRSEYDNLSPLPNGHIFFTKSASKGLITNQGKQFFEADEITNHWYPDRGNGVNYVYYGIGPSGNRKYGLLDTSTAELKWVIVPVYDTILIDKNRGFIYTKKRNEQSVWSLSNGKPLVQQVAKLMVPETTGKVYALSKRVLYSLSSMESKPLKIGRFRDFTRVGNKAGDFLFVKKRRWYFAKEEAGKFEMQDLQSDSIYPFISTCEQQPEAQLVFRRHGLYGIRNLLGDTVLPCQYSDFIPIEDGASFLLIQPDGNIRYQGACGTSFRSGRYKLWDRPGIKKLDYTTYQYTRMGSGKRRSGLVNPNRSFLLSAEYLKFEMLSDRLVRVYEKELPYLQQDKTIGQGVLDLEDFTWLVKPGQYPILEFNQERESLRFGYPDSLCVLEYSGYYLAKWEKVADAEYHDECCVFYAVDTFSVGIKDAQNPKEWVLQPNYCAVSAYDTTRKIASVRACPISRYYGEMGYWNPPDVPTLGNWGIVDVRGSWVIDPISKYALDLSLDTFIVQGKHGFSLYTIDGKNVLDTSFKYLSEVDNRTGCYWTTNKAGKMGMVSSKGEALIPGLYDTILIHDQGYFAVLLGDGNVVGFKWNFEVEVLSELKQFHILYETYESLCDGDGDCLPKLDFERAGYNDAIAYWLYTNWYKTLLDGSIEIHTRIEYTQEDDQGFSHPQYRKIEDPYFQYSSGGGSSRYSSWRTSAHKQGVSLTENYMVCYSGHHGPGSCFQAENFHNLKIENGVARSLMLWGILDSSRVDELIDTVLYRIGQSQQELSCAPEGDHTGLIDDMEQHFRVSQDSIYLYLPLSYVPEHAEALNERFLIIDLELPFWARKDW